jgi:hypothetical protein
MPTSHTDFLALLHDIQYLQTKRVSPYKADTTALDNTDNSFQSFLMQIGLRTRRAFNLPFYQTDNLIQSNKMGDKAMQFVQTDEQYKKLFRIYGVDPHNYPYK